MKAKQKRRGRPIEKGQVLNPAGGPVGLGRPPENLVAMRRILKTNADEDRNDGERELRKWFTDDKPRFMAALDRAEQAWAQGRVPAGREPGTSVPVGGEGPAVADEGLDRTDEAIRRWFVEEAERASRPPAGPPPG